ncbi:MAG: N-6 DNA methylase [Bacillales bacterium]
MKLSDIKRINQRIYTLDTDISRNSKVIFIAALVICLTRNKDFRNLSKLTTLIDFNNEKVKPIDQLIEFAVKEIDNMGLQESTRAAVKNSFKLISGVNTNLDRDRYEFQKFIAEFISNDFASIQPSDLFFENLYMEIDRKASKSDAGIVLTPIFIAQLMVDLAEIDYKKDVIADLCSGTGLFSLLSYSKMLSDMENDYKNGIITKEESDKYHERLLNSIVANDNEPKMVTLCLANFLLKSLNFELLYCGDILTLS